MRRKVGLEVENASHDWISCYRSLRWKSKLSQWRIDVRKRRSPQNMKCQNKFWTGRAFPSESFSWNNLALAVETLWPPIQYPATGIEAAPSHACSVSYGEVRLGKVDVCEILCVFCVLKVCHQSHQFSPHMTFIQESQYISAYPSYADSTQLQLHCYKIVAGSQLLSDSCRLRSAFCRSFTSAPPWCELMWRWVTFSAQELGNELWRT